MGEKPRELIQSVVKAVDVLDVLASVQNSSGLVDLSQKLGMSKSTVHRLLSTLVFCGLVEQDPQTREYMLGLRLFELGNTVPRRFDLGQLHEYLLQLNELTQETTHLGILHDGQVVYVDKVESKKTIRMHSRLGRRVPFYCTSLGKVLAAYLQPGAREAVIQQTKLERFTKNTITNPACLREHLDLVKSQGFAVDDQEHEKHITCVGGPVFNHRGQVTAAFSVSGPSFRMTSQKVGELIPLVLDFSKKMSAVYGFKNS